MTKAKQVYESNLTDKEKYNQLLEMWEQGKQYANTNEITDEQYKRFSEIPLLLSNLLLKIEPDSSKLTPDQVFGGFYE